MQIKNRGVYSNKADQLKGYINESQPCIINDCLCIAKKDFNIYEEHGFYKRFLDKNKFEVKTSEQFLQWLEGENIVTRSKAKSRMKDQLSKYRTFPLCPRYKAIENAHDLILSSIPIKNREFYLSLINSDVFNLALYLERHIGFKLRNENKYEQITQLIEQVKEEIKQYEDQYLISKGETQCSSS